MKCVVVLWIAIHAISGVVHHASAYAPGYGVPVHSQPIVYTSPTYHGSYQHVGPYAYTSPAVSHSYSHTQTHPVAYVRPVTYYNPSSSYYAPAYSPAAYTSSAYTAGQYYTPATSNIENTRLVIPQTNRNFRYQTNQQYNSPDSRDGAAQQQQQQQFGGNSGAQKPTQTIHIHIQREPNSPYTQSANGQQQQQQTQGQFNNGQNQFNQQKQQFNRKGLTSANRNVYADRMPYTNNGEQVKLRQYRVHRPGVEKQFYDVEEHVIVRPAGSTLIEFDTPTKKEDITDYQQSSGGHNFNSNPQRQQFNRKGGYQPNNGNQQTFNDQNDESQQYFAQPQFVQTAPVYRVPDCGGYDDDDEQTIVTPVPPVNEYGPPTVTGSGGSQGSGVNVIITESGSGVGTGVSGGGSGVGVGNRKTPQYHPTTFAPPTGGNRFPPQSSGYPTTVIPLPPRPTYYPSQTPSVGGGSYGGGSYGGGSYGGYPQTVPQYPLTPGNPVFRPTSGQYTPSTVAATKAATPGQQQSDIFISSTTPVSVTIVDKNENASTKTTGTQDTPDIVYGQSDQDQFGENTPDQVQNELPPRGDLSQYQSDQSDQFYHELPRSRYTNGPNQRQPQAFNVYARSRGEPTESPYNSQKNADLVEIDEKKDRNFTNNNRNGDQNSRYTNSNDGQNNKKNGQYQDEGVRGRVIAVTPAPATFTPTETVNHRRVVVTKPVELVQLVVEPENSTTNNGQKQRGNYRGNYADGRGNQGNQNYNNQNSQYQNNDFESNDGNDGDSAPAQYNNNFNGESGRYQNANDNDNDQFNGNDNDDDAEFNRNADYQQNNSEFNGQYRNGNENFGNQNANYNDKYQNDNADFDQDAEFNGQYRNDNNNNNNFNRNSNQQKGEYRNPNQNQFSNSDVTYARNTNDQKSKNANYEDSVSSKTAQTPSAGVYISTTPSSASQRIIYVQPVSQEFASQKAVPPKKQ